MPAFRNKPVDFVIDVRSRLEFWLGHLEGATCIPVDTITDGVPKLPGVTKSSRILVYCASGARSAAAAQALRSMGYQRITDGGGIAEARASYSAK